MDTLIDVTRLMTLWARPPATDDDALAEIRALYHDPVTINGTSFTARDLLLRVRAMQRAYGALQHTLLDQVETADRLVVAFRLTGRHTGPLTTPLGELRTTWRNFAVRVIDILTVTDSRISAVTMVADELAQLVALGALRPFPGTRTPQAERCRS